MALVSVLVNVLNGERTIVRALKSALTQTHFDLEVVVWNNGSTDATERLVREISDPRVRYFKTDDTVPLYQARNRALTQCMGTFVSFLDADDWWRSDKLERQLELLTTGVAAVYSNYFVVNEISGRTRRYSRCDLPSGLIFSDLLKRYRVGLLTLIVRKEALERLSFDSSLEIIGDFDFVMRLAKDSMILCVQEPLAWSQFDGNNESEKKKERHLHELDHWCKGGEVDGSLQGRDLRNMRRMVRAKKAEVAIEGGHYARGLVELLQVQPLGRQVKVVQRIMTSRRSVRLKAKEIDRP